MNLEPYNSITDRTKLAEIEASMAASGWIGAPVVTDGDNIALTGSHRIVAADTLIRRWEAGEAVAYIAYIPTIDIREVWDEAGIANSIDDILLYETPDEYGIICQTIREQAPAVAAEYGLDIH